MLALVGLQRLWSIHEAAGAGLNELRGNDPASIVSSYRGTGRFPERIADLPQPTFSAISVSCFG